MEVTGGQRCHQWVAFAANLVFASLGDYIISQVPYTYLVVNKRYDHLLTYYARMLYLVHVFLFHNSNICLHPCSHYATEGKNIMIHIRFKKNERE